MRARWRWVLVILAGCHQSTVTTSSRQAEAGAAPDPESARVLAAHVGECVAMTGFLTGAKVGPVLLLGEHALWLGAQRGAREWTSLPLGTRVNVRGTVRPQDDWRRYAIEDPIIEVLRSVQDVDRDLRQNIGRVVSLDGALRSKNGTWWLRHDGVDVHLESGARIPDTYPALHDRLVTLRGRLARKPMPRLDQVAIKAAPDVAEAFVISVDDFALRPDSEIQRCREPTD